MRIFIFALLLFAAPVVAAETKLIGQYVWADDDPRFGGFSAIEISDDGERLIALSDRGHFVEARVERSRGVITDVVIDRYIRLTDENGGSLMRALNDSEGLALHPDGTLSVSFEWTHGVRRFVAPDQPPSPLIVAPGFSILQPNSSLEALAVDADGTLYTIPERSGRAGVPFPVYRYRSGSWDTAFEIPREDSFLVTGADFGPDGMLYVLERDFFGVGFRSRVRRFSPDGTNAEVLLVTGIRTHDNLEGISVWEDSAGLRMTLISDDNFGDFQETQIVEYRLTEH